jgi:hypothetical protein
MRPLRSLVLSGLLSAAALGVSAQELVNRQDVQNYDMSGRYRYALTADRIVIDSHLHLARALAHQQASVDVAGNPTPPFLETWFTDHDSVDGLAEADAASAGMSDNLVTAHTWGIFHRLCNAGGTNPPGTWYLLTYMDPPFVDGFKFGWTAAEMQANAAKYFDLHGGGFDATRDGVGVFDTTGESPTYTAYGAAPVAMPPCLIDNSSATYWSPLTRGQYLAMMTRVTPGYSVTHRQIAYSYQSCPPPGHPDLTIGVAYMKSETDSFTQPNGKPIVDSNGQPVTVTQPPVYVAGCAAPQKQTRPLLQSCIAGGWTDGFGKHFDIKGFNRYDQVYVQSPVAVAPTPQNMLNSFQWVPDTTQAPVLVHSDCAGAKVSPFSETSTGKSQQQQTLQCAAVYPRYPNGTLIRTRTATTTTETLPAGSKPASISSTTYSPWQTTSNTCSNTQTVQQAQTLACPAGYTGAVTQTETGTQTNYATGGSTVAWNNNWQTKSNSCAQQPVVQPGCYRASGDHGRTETICPTPNNSGRSGSGGWRDTTRLGGMADYGAKDAAEASAMAAAGVGSNGNNNTGGSKSGRGSFIGSALARRRGEELDESEMLGALRRWRNGWVRRQPGGWALVQEYYQLGWTLILTIPSSHDDWVWIGDRVDEIHAAIDADDNWLALDLYVAMVRHLQAKWLNHGACV